MAIERTPLRFVSCTHESHARETLDILNEAIVNSTALYDYKPRKPESMVAWFQAKEAGRYPVVGAVAEGGQLLGFATYGAFRAWPAYKYSVEHSVYVHKDHRGRGIGLALMSQLIDAATNQQYHVILGGIDVAIVAVSHSTNNSASRTPVQSNTSDSSSAVGSISRSIS